MSIISVDQLSKHFRVLNRHEGLGGAFRDLFSRDYKTVKAVDGISFQVERGEIVGFIGPNGAGKSTTIKMLIGVLEATGGKIEVNGYVPYKQRRQYVNRIGVVLGQRTQLWWDLPVIESFKILREIYRVPKETYERNLGLFDDLLKLSELYSKPVRTLSLGQRMLCDIAASFLHDPDIIFLDEPTIGLDVDVRSKVRHIIRELNKLKGTTIILTSHDVGDIEELAQRIILIDKGTLLYDGKAETFTNIFGAYRTLKLDVRLLSEADLTGMPGKLKNAFPGVDDLSAGSVEGGWVDITLNQDKVPLLDVLNLLMSHYKLQDIKVEEIEMEKVIRRVYEGALR